MKSKTLAQRIITLVFLLSITAILLLIFFTVPELVPLFPLGFTPLLFLFGSSRRWLASAASLIIIIMVWFGLMVGVNGIESVKENLTHGFESMMNTNKR